MGNHNTYDAIVVGARAAGSPLAMLLARKGHRVLVVDRASFPSDTLSTHQLAPRGVASLERWGLLDQLAATGCPPVDSVSFDFGPFAIAGQFLPGDSGVVTAYNPRRTVLDKMLVDAAAESGAEVRTGFFVQDLIIEQGRVRGIRGRDASGATVEERARVVIGADGKHSRIAELVSAREYNARPSLSFGYYGYWSGWPMHGRTEVYLRGTTAVIVAETHDGQTMVCVQGSIGGFDDFRKDVTGNYMRALAGVDALRDRIASARLDSRLYGTADLRNFFRKPFGPGWALVGDAGYHRDPTLGQGISDAFRDAEALATALDSVWRGVADERPALSAYQQERDVASLPMYDLVTAMATMEPPPPEMQAALVAIKDDRAQCDRFISATLGSIPMEEFYGAENMARIAAAAAPPAGRARADIHAGVETSVMSSAVVGPVIAPATV